MFKGNMRPQVEFGDAGVVAIGCNLHDHMVGYILVVDSPAFATTGRDGTTQLLADNPDGLSVSIWSPRIRLNDESSQLTLTGVPNLVYLVEYADNSQTWNLLEEVTLNSSTETVTDSNTLNVPFRFYRAREKP